MGSPSILLHAYRVCVLPCPSQRPLKKAMGLPLPFAYGPEFSKYGELKSPDPCSLFVLSWLGLGPMMKC